MSLLRYQFQLSPTLQSGPIFNPTAPSVRREFANEQLHTILPASYHWLASVTSIRKPPFNVWATGYGFIGLISDYLNMYRCLVVETTLPDAEAGHPNLVRRRFWVRRFMEFLTISFIPISVIGGVSNSKFAMLIGAEGAEYSVRSL